MTLEEVLQFVQAKEAGKQDSSQLSGTGGGLCRISDFQRDKTNKPPYIKPPLSPPGGLKVGKMEDKCTWCGQTGHGALVTEDERRQKCRAFDKVCRTCGKANNLDSVCRSKKRPESTSSQPRNTNSLEANTSNLGVGPFCCISTSPGPRTILGH